MPLQLQGLSQTAFLLRLEEGSVGMELTLSSTLVLVFTVTTMMTRELTSLLLMMMMNHRVLQQHKRCLGLLLSHRPGPGLRPARHRPSPRQGACLLPLCPEVLWASNAEILLAGAVRGETSAFSTTAIILAGLQQQWWRLWARAQLASGVAWA